jgi:hypothetical protein
MYVFPTDVAARVQNGVIFRGRPDGAEEVDSR